MILLYKFKYQRLNCRDDIEYWFISIFWSYCNTTHERTSGKVKSLVDKYLPQLFQPNLLCAGYESAGGGSCEGDSGGPLMVFSTKLSKFFQVGMVAGGVADCGDKDIPGYYTRLDYPEIANFIQAPEGYSSSGNSNMCFKCSGRGLTNVLF